MKKQENNYNDIKTTVSRKTHKLTCFILTLILGITDLHDSETEICAWGIVWIVLFIYSIMLTRIGIGWYMMVFLLIVAVAFSLIVLITSFFDKDRGAEQH